VLSRKRLSVTEGCFQCARVQHNVIRQTLMCEVCIVHGKQAFYEVLNDLLAEIACETVSQSLLTFGALQQYYVLLMQSSAMIRVSKCAWPMQVHL
jgi:hypothetical protein